MFSNQNSCQISKGIANPGTDEDHPYQINAILEFPCLINKRKHHWRIGKAEKSSHHLGCFILGKSKHIDEHKADHHE